MSNTRPEPKKNKTYTSLQDLEEDQLQVKAAYEDMEQNAFSYLFDPQSIGLNLAARLLDTKGSKGFSLPGLFSRKKKTPPRPAVAASRSSQQVPARKKYGLLRKVGISFLKWQAFNLACWGLGKAYDHYKASRKQGKTIKALEKSTQQLQKAID